MRDLSERGSLRGIKKWTAVTACELTSVSRGEPNATVRKPPEKAWGMLWEVRQAERIEHARKHWSSRDIYSTEDGEV